MMLRRFRPGFTRTFATNFKERPGPPPLDREAQLEFERLQKEAMASDAPHPEVRKVYHDFEGDVNPETGEVGGPKQDPLRHGDYSFNGRVTDF